MTDKPPDGFGVSESKARELVKERKQAVEAQLKAYPYRGAGQGGKNLAGWIVAAIEKDYDLPRVYIEALEREQEIRRAKAKQAALEDCALCDSSGLRYLGGKKGVKKCSHDPDIEVKYPSA